MHLWDPQAQLTLADLVLLQHLQDLLGRSTLADRLAPGDRRLHLHRQDQRGQSTLVDQPDPVDRVLRQLLQAL